METLSTILLLVLSPIKPIGDTFHHFAARFVAYQAYWRHFPPISSWFCRLLSLLETLSTNFKLVLSPIKPIGDTFHHFAARFVAYQAYWGHFSRFCCSFCRLSSLLETFSTILLLVLSPIELIGDTFHHFAARFVAYQAYWRHFLPICCSFCRLSSLLETFSPHLLLVLSPIELIGNIFFEFTPGFVAYSPCLASYSLSKKNKRHIDGSSMALTFFFNRYSIH
ncbi:hypothetical protein J2Y67_002448 [Neobacillus niacini]|nr:hypothetical protein [Neobacillus niacini]